VRKIQADCDCATAPGDLKLAVLIVLQLNLEQSKHRETFFGAIHPSDIRHPWSDSTFETGPDGTIPDQLTPVFLRITNEI
jgi:hypothetical protein